MYIWLFTDIVHCGHLAIIQKVVAPGHCTVGILAGAAIWLDTAPHTVGILRQINTRFRKIAKADGFDAKIAQVSTQLEVLETQL